MHLAPTKLLLKKKKKKRTPQSIVYIFSVDCFATKACGDNYKMMTTKGQWQFFQKKKLIKIAAPLFIEMRRVFSQDNKKDYGVGYFWQHLMHFNQ